MEILSIIIIFLAGASDGFIFIGVIAIAFAIFIVALKMPRIYRCNSCGAKFKLPTFK